MNKDEAANKIAENEVGLQIIDILHEWSQRFPQDTDALANRLSLLVRLISSDIVSSIPNKGHILDVALITAKSIMESTKADIDNVEAFTDGKIARH